MSGQRTAVGLCRAHDYRQAAVRASTGTPSYGRSPSNTATTEPMTHPEPASKPEWLAKRRHAVQHTSCTVSPIVVRLPAAGRTRLDFRPLEGTRDAVGLGASVEQAAQHARLARELQALFQTT